MGGNVEAPLLDEDLRARATTRLVPPLRSSGLAQPESVEVRLGEGGIELQARAFRQVEAGISRRRISMPGRRTRPTASRMRTRARRSVAFTADFWAGGTGRNFAPELMTIAKGR